MTRTLVQVIKPASIPEQGISVKDFTPHGYKLVNLQYQNDCIFLTFHEMEEDEEMLDAEHT
jgi:hypothetical protein